MGILNKISDIKAEYREKRIRRRGEMLKELTREGAQAKREKALLKTEQKLKKEIETARKLRKDNSILSRFKRGVTSLKVEEKKLKKATKNLSPAPSSNFQLGGGSPNSVFALGGNSNNRKRKGPFDL